MTPIKYNKTKIIATIGPASLDYSVLKKMIRKGVDVCRINASHADHAMQKKIISLVQKLNRELGTNICTLLDLCGPKIRTGEMLRNAVRLRNGQNLAVTTKKCLGTSGRIYIDYPHLAKEIQPDTEILLDDGLIKLKVISTNHKDTLHTKVIDGGILSSHKGVNIPNASLSVPSLTKKDLSDLKFGLRNGVEWVALSFVRSAKDIMQIKSLIKKWNPEDSGAKVIAKIEKQEALNNIYEIIEAADAVMVARGDLGVETPMENVPLLQKQIIRICSHASRPVIIATQMMESMIEHPRPTRAETNDVANAVLDGADALMLSAETSVGKYPADVIDAMQSIIAAVEKQNYIYNRYVHLDKNSPTYHPDSICLAACQMAQELEAEAVTGMTVTGYTAFELSKHRPRADVFIFSDNEKLLRATNLIWGVRGIYYKRFVSTDETIRDLKDLLLKKKLVREGDVVINTVSTPLRAKKKTNTLRVTLVKRSDT